ncbi:MAG: hypothetical protein Q8877_02345 [Sweet potato little leaf phytoplasma]|nr:hypothetical protein [Sweet potato little leaf phytoplasma]
MKLGENLVRPGAQDHTQARKLARGPAKKCAQAHGLGAQERPTSSKTPHHSSSSFISHFLPLSSTSLIPNLSNLHSTKV